MWSLTAYCGRWWQSHKIYNSGLFLSAERETSLLHPRARRKIDESVDHCADTERRFPGVETRWCGVARVVSLVCLLSLDKRRVVFAVCTFSRKFWAKWIVKKNSGPWSASDVVWILSTPYTGDIRVSSYRVFILSTLRKSVQKHSQWWRSLIWRPEYSRDEALGSHFVSHGTIKCIVAYVETSETRWRRPWFSTVNAAPLVCL